MNAYVLKVFELHKPVRFCLLDFKKSIDDRLSLQFTSFQFPLYDLGDGDMLLFSNC